MLKTNYIYTGGTFDVMHIGHLELLRECARYGLVIVALNTDAFVKRYKGVEVQPYNVRKSNLIKSPYVYMVVKNIGDEDSKKTIESLEEDICAIAHGTDWTGDSLYKQMGLTQEWLNDRMISMLYIPRTTGQSSTKIRNKYNVKNVNQIYKFNPNNK